MQNRVIRVFAIAAIVITVGCYKERTVSPSDVIKAMTHSPGSIDADGVSRTLITVTLPDETTDASGNVSLTTTKGLFDIVAKNATTAAAQNVVGTDGKVHRVASAWLISSTEETQAYITATVKSFTHVDSVTFARAFPDSIKVKVDKLLYLPGNTSEVAVTVQLKRNPGKGTPSANQPIALSAIDGSAASIGTFRNKVLITDATGACINYFSLPPGSSYTGPVIFTARVQVNVAGDTRIDSQTINVIH